MIRVKLNHIILSLLILLVALIQGHVAQLPVEKSQGLVASVKILPGL